MCIFITKKSLIGVNQISTDISNYYKTFYKLLAKPFILFANVC